MWKIKNIKLKHFHIISIIALLKIFDTTYLSSLKFHVYTIVYQAFKTLKFKIDVVLLKH